jgi:eukaryotic-like serine/threonine-protein kinase
MQSSHPEARGVGRYIIYGELASGGMAAVYLGQSLGQAGFSRAVAIKRLHEHLAREPEFVAMLIDEAKLLSSVHHPNVVSTLDIVCENDDLLIVMDYVEGETLAMLLREAGKRSPGRGPSPAVVSRIMLDALEGLHAAHTAKTHKGEPLNIVHRDVSPQNIMVGVDGVARVLDFGVAKAEHRRHVTRPGHIKGKFSYMSPEQVRGARVDARTDVFATGIVLWECLTGHRLFAPTEKTRGVERVLTMPIPRPSTHDKTLSREIDDVVMRALERDPAARYASAADFARALHAAIQPACPTEVASWVADIAKGSIVAHARLLRELETSAVSERAGERVERVADVPTVSAPGPSLRAVTADLATVPSGPPVFEPSRRVTRAGARRALWVALGTASFCVLAALRIGTAEPPIPEKPEATSNREAGSADSATRPGIVETTITEVEDVAARPALVITPTVEPVVTPTPQPVTSLSPTSRSGGVRSSRRLARTPPAPSFQKPNNVATPAPVPATSRAPEVTPAPQPVNACDPPYRVDAFGVRRVRRECL